MYELFNFKIIKDSLFLRAIHQDKREENIAYFGIRFNKKKCNLERDFYSDNLVGITLESTEQKGLAIHLEDKTPRRYIYFGLDKQTGEKAIEFDDRILTKENLPMRVLKMKAKTHQADWKNLSLIINKDRSILDKFVAATIKSMEEEGLLFKEFYTLRISEKNKLILEQKDF